MAAETELKFRVPGRKLKALEKPRIAGAKSSEASTSDLVSTYFDTAKHKLKRHGLTLRVRYDGHNYVQTIKSGAGPQLERGEWESELRDEAFDLEKAEGTPLEELASGRLRRKLKRCSRRRCGASRCRCGRSGARSSSPSTAGTQQPAIGPVRSRRSSSS